MSNRETGNIERRDQMDSQAKDRSSYRQTYLNQGLVEQALIDHLNLTGTVQVEWGIEAQSLEVLSEINSSDKESSVAVVIGEAEGQSERPRVRFQVDD